MVDSQLYEQQREKALITGITGQVGAALTESLLANDYARQSPAAPGLDADLELSGLAAPSAGRRTLAERFGDWHRWDGQVTLYQACPAPSTCGTRYSQ